MWGKPFWVVTLYTPSQCVEGIYGPFADAHAADVFGRTSGRRRYLISQVRPPRLKLFDPDESDSEKEGGR